MAGGRFVGGLWAGLVKCRGEVGAERGRGGRRRRAGVSDGGEVGGRPSAF